MTIELALAFAKGFLIVLATMLPILNPAATAPIFLSLTDGASPADSGLFAALCLILLCLGVQIVRDGFSE